ncbi:MAG: YqiA/YcfP family alpha/beta fold hydrolase [Mariprofundaceae bacterium]
MNITTDQLPNVCVYLLHGFASAPKYPSDKAVVLEAVFNLPVKQLVYDSAASFADNLIMLKGQVDMPAQFFVGTSLGAFYANKLAEFFYSKFAAGSIMLNPCCNPYRVLPSLKGAHTNFVTGDYFELTQNVISSYQDSSFLDRSEVLPRWILLNMDDALIDAFETKERYKHALEVITFEHGGHRFENMDSNEVTNALKRISNTNFFHGVTND